MAITREQLDYLAIYRVIGNTSNHMFESGDLVSLHHDDHFSFPCFTNDKGGKWYVPFDDLEVYKDKDRKMKNFTKDDLKDWMIVETRNGRLYLTNIVAGKFIGYNNYYISFCNFDEGLKCCGDSNLDIIKVYNFKYKGGFMGLFDNKGSLIWEREDRSKTQLKIEEIEKKQRELADELAQLKEEV